MLTSFLFLTLALSLSIKTYFKLLIHILKLKLTRFVGDMGVNGNVVLLKLE